MGEETFNDTFTIDTLKALFPENRADAFFDALYGDASEGAYDISLAFKEKSGDKLVFEFHLHQRSGKCLACNLTYGLPEVFTRHPIINVSQLVEAIETLLDGDATLKTWQIGATKEISTELHTIPLIISMDT